MEKEELLKIIDDAFDGVEQPKEITLHVAEAHDAYDYEHDGDHRKNDYFGPWQNVPEEHIKKCQDALSYLEKVGFRYYLPAYMVWYLKNMENDDEVWTDNALYALDNYPRDSELSRHKKEQLSLFNTKQLRACAQFVKYCAEDETGFADTYFAKKKYERFWYQYDTK